MTHHTLGVEPLVLASVLTPRPDWGIEERLPEVDALPDIREYCKREGGGMRE